MRLFWLLSAFVLVSVLYSCDSRSSTTGMVKDGCCSIFRDSLTAWMEKNGKFPAQLYQVQGDSITFSLNETWKNMIWSGRPADSQLDSLGKVCGFSVKKNQASGNSGYLFVFPLDKSDSSYSIPCDLLLFMFENRSSDE